MKVYSRPDYEIQTLKTRDDLSFTYREGSSDKKAIAEACANIVDEQKRTSSYERIRKEPYFRIESGDIFLDLGSNIGSFAIRAIKNGAQKVIAVEPEATNLALLKKNIEDNNMLKQIKVEKCAVVAKKTEEKVTLHVTPSTYRNTILAVKNTVSTQKVPAKTLTEIFEKYPNINPVKLGIEGNEASVLKSINWKKTMVKKLVAEYSMDHHPVMNEFYDLIDHLKKNFTTVYHRQALPERNEIWDVTKTRGANGIMIWCIRGDTVMKAGKDKS